MNVSVVIPCHIKDLGDLKKTIYDWGNQSIKPDEIIVYLKPIPNNFEHDLYDIKLGDIKLKVLTSHDESTKGFAKNRAIENATSDLICISDSDDRIHPDKIKYILDIFENNPNCEMFLHGYTYNDTSIFEISFNKNYELKQLNHSNGLGKTNIDHWNMLYQIHNAHVTIKKQIFEYHKYDELEVDGCDDSLFTNDACAKNIKILYSPVQLVSYER